MKKIVLLIGIFILTSFTIIKVQYTAQDIVNRAIEYAGGTRFDHAIVSFDFRGKNYRSSRDSGEYQLERVIDKENEQLHDVLSNSGLTRSINNCVTKVADSLVTRISDGVNSVHYFANLPYGLNAKAVHKKLIGESIIKGNTYYTIQVTFEEKGGGTDFDDEFLYWIHKDRFTVDYLAYKYATNGGGIRFREAYNPRVVNGIRFVDYNNYKPIDLSSALSTLDQLFEKGQLKLLSKIVLENIQVYVQEDCC